MIQNLRNKITIRLNFPTWNVFAYLNKNAQVSYFLDATFYYITNFESSLPLETIKNSWRPLGSTNNILIQIFCTFVCVSLFTLPTIRFLFFSSSFFSFGLIDNMSFLDFLSTVTILTWTFCSHCACIKNDGIQIHLKQNFNTYLKSVYQLSKLNLANKGWQKLKFLMVINP